MARADFRFAWEKRVHYPEIDAQAVVYNSRYLEYFDIALTEYWAHGVQHAVWYDRASTGCQCFGAGGAAHHQASAYRHEQEEVVDRTRLD